MKITLKSNINDLLTEPFEGQTLYHTDFIGCTDEVKALLGTTIEADIDCFREEAIVDEFKFIDVPVLFYPVNADTPIHYKWVDSINGEPIHQLITINGTSAAYVDISASYFVEIATNTLVNKSSVSVCHICSNPVEDTTIKICNHCLETKYFDVKSHSYIPQSFIFTGKQTGKLAKENPRWYGLELEYGLKNKLDMAKLVYKHSPLLYLKHDGSIEGGNHKAELVSHPMSFSELTKPTSFINDLGSLKVVDNPSTNGCHIHVSRTAFKDDKHYAKFKFLIQSNIPLLEAIGGRTLTRYCKPNVATQRAINLTKKDIKQTDKYLVCNEIHTNTIELRFMASSNKPAQVLRYLEFIDSMILYTAYHTSTATYADYKKYVSRHSNTYPNINSLLASTTIPLEGAITYKKTSEVTCDIKKIPFNCVANIVRYSITFANGNTSVIDEAVSSSGVNLSFDQITGELKNFNGYGVTPEDVITVTYIK